MAVVAAFLEGKGEETLKRGRNIGLSILRAAVDGT
jgi:hypothetical protein